MKSRFTIVERTHTKRFYKGGISEKSIVCLKKSKIWVVNVYFFNATLHGQT